MEEAYKPPLHTERGHSIRHHFKRLTWCTAREVQSMLKTIITVIEVEDQPIELQTLRYREALDTVADLNNLGSKSEALLGLEVTILSKLILIYEQREDAPAVRRFSLRRSKLHHGSPTMYKHYTLHAAQSWAETCGKLPALLTSLDLQIDAPFYTNGRPVFPAKQSALRRGHKELADALDEVDGTQQNLDMLKQTPLLAAATAGKLPSLGKHLHDDKSMLRNRDLFCRTVLFHAAYRGPLETVVSLVRAGANVLDRDEAGQSILCAASAGGNADIVRWLLECGGVPNPNDHVWGPRSPLHDAARAGHREVCLILLEKGAHVDYLVDGVTPAHAARANGFGELADLLGEAASQYPYRQSFNTAPTCFHDYCLQRSSHAQVSPYSCPTPGLFDVESILLLHEMDGNFSDIHRPSKEQSPINKGRETETTTSKGSPPAFEPCRLFGD